MNKKAWFWGLALGLWLVFVIELGLVSSNINTKQEATLPPEPIVIEIVIYRYYDDASVRYVYTPFPESWEIADNTTLAEFPLSLEQTIKSSLDGAYAHLYWYKQGVDTDHNLYWWNVHKSAVYWMEEGK